MNERIRELAEQAREYAITRHPVSNIVLLVNSEKFEEKFAELIVKDCTYQCYLIGESGLAHELSDKFGFKFDFRKMMEDEDE